MKGIPGIDLRAPSEAGSATLAVPFTDIERQTSTAKALLKRLETRPVQLLADEVGMGKTYVALAVAGALRSAGKSARVAVLVPNQELARKWQREVRSFMESCVVDPKLRLHSPTGDGTFVIDDPAALHSTAPARQLAIIRYGPQGLASKQLQDQDLRLRSAAWAVDTDPTMRNNGGLLRRAYRAKSLSDVDASVVAAVRALKADHRPILPWPQPTGRNRWRPDEIEGDTGHDLWLAAVRRIKEAPSRPHGAIRDAANRSLLKLVRAALLSQIKPFDLVIVDEAHNWVNRANGADAARLAFLSRARSALLLTATPLQLDPDDLPALLGQFADLGEALRRKPPDSLSRELPNISSKLRLASQSADQFRLAWTALPTDVSVVATGERVSVADVRLAAAIADLDGANRALEDVLRPWFIRHRRSKDHRRVLIGDEFTVEHVGPRRPEIAELTVLHDASGLENDHAQLAQLAVMRLVGLALAETKRPGRTSLAASMTGSYSTLLASKEAVHLSKTTPQARPYLDLIRPHIDTERRLLAGKTVQLKNLHPKLQVTLQTVEELWQDGEKVLIYCWRINTARVVAAGIRQRLGARTTGPTWTAFQQRLTRFPLNVSTQDRLVHSLCLAGHIDASYRRLVEETRDAGVAAIAALALPSRLSAADVRRANRVHQVVLAAAALDSGADDFATDILEAFVAGTQSTERAGRPSAAVAQRLLRALFDEPALLTGGIDEENDSAGAPTLARAINQYAMRFGAEPLHALKRRDHMTSLLTSAIQSTNTLARLPGLHPDDHPGAHELAASLGQPMRRGGHGHAAESMLERLAHLVDEFQGIENLRNLDEALAEFSATRDRSPVAEVTGKTGPAERNRLFERFNSPLFPDVLVCTQIGGEGIDLHRFCRVVIHYDLSFNPAKLEQRTGRCDRIGSKAATDHTDLIVGVPLLAGSYDERIFATLLQRDREQEALIGGGVGGEQGITAIEDDQEDSPADAPNGSAISRRPIPPALVDYLRCSYHIWSQSVSGADIGKSPWGAREPA